MSRFTSLQTLPTFNREPVAIINALIGVIETGFALSVVFGLDLTPEQTGTAMAFIVAFATLIQTIWARSLVTPVGSSYDEES